jgi:transposase-like protein
MPLSRSQLKLELTFTCPHCRHALVKTGNWFKTVSRFKCNRCKSAIQMSYNDKVALFEKHGPSRERHP